MYGVIPIVRADLEISTQLKECSLIFSKFDNNKKIISTCSHLLSQKEKMKEMAYKSWSNGEMFSFDFVKERYNNLYQSLLQVRN
jgi:hypothetical protein